LNKNVIKYNYDMSKIKVAYVETWGIYEDYAQATSAYGGCSVFARWAKELWNNSDEFEFYIFAPGNCFRNVRIDKERADKCMPMEKDSIIDDIKAGLPIKDLMPGMEFFDIVMHHGSGISINMEGLKAKQVFWGPFGKSEEAHEEVDHVFCFRERQKPLRKGQNIYKIVLGKPVPDRFVPPPPKEDFIFQCTRHDQQTNTIEVLEQCIKNEIKGYIAGPPFEDEEVGKAYPFLSDDKKYYPIWDHIDDKHSFYIGHPISEHQKIDFTCRSRLTTYLFKRNPSFNQSVVESLSVGTPILVPKESLPERGIGTECMYEGEIIEDEQWLKDAADFGETGLFYDGTNFAECFERAKDIDPKKCWEKSREYSLDKMFESFEVGVRNVMDA